MQTAANRTKRKLTKLQEDINAESLERLRARSFHDDSRLLPCSQLDRLPPRARRERRSIVGHLDLDVVDCEVARW